MKLKDIKGFLVVDSDILVEDATNDEYSYIEDFSMENKKKMDQYKDATLTAIAPGVKGRVLISVSINNGVFTED